MDRSGSPSQKHATSTIAGDLAAWCHAAHAGGWAGEVEVKARLCLIDSLSCILTSDIAERSGMAWHAVNGGTKGQTGPCSIIGTAHRSSPDAAAFVNATSASSTSRADTIAESATHPGMTLVPAILAVAEQRDASLQRVLGAIVVGYEVMARSARAIIVPELSSRLRPTGLVGALSSAASCSTVLRLGRFETQQAIAIAAQTFSGLNQWAREGTTDHVHHIATASANGVRAAYLAEAGATAPEQIFEGQSGLLAAFGLSGREHFLTEQLGRRFSILDAVFKAAPACMYAQAAVQAASRLVDAPGLLPEDVVDVEIRTCRMGAEYPGCNNSGSIDTYQAAKQSIQFSVASILASGEVRDESWLDFTNPAFNAIAAKTHIVVDESYTTTFPGKLGVAIRVTLRDGRALQIAMDDMAPVTGEEVVGRFLAVALPRIGRANAEAVLAMLENPQGSDARSMIALLSRQWFFPTLERSA